MPTLTTRLTSAWWALALLAATADFAQAQPESVGTEGAGEAKRSLPWMSLDSRHGIRVRQWYDSLEDPDPVALEEAEKKVAAGQFRDALGSLKRLRRWYKDKPKEEDVLYLLGECNYRTDNLPESQDLFAELLRKYPTTRHLPAAIQRTYDIAYYWLEDARRRSQGEPPAHGPVSRRVNFFDKSRPFLDTEGRALEAIQTIQQYDPLGPLTDDAMMMAGAQQFVNGRFIRAAGSYEQIAVDQPRSEHAPKALVLAAQSNLRAYSGPNYDSQDLDAAERNVRAAIARGADLPVEQRQQLEADLQLIRRERAHRDYSAGLYFERLRKTQAAVYYYRIVMDEHRDSQWADQANQALARLEGKIKPESLPAPTAPNEDRSFLAFRRKDREAAGAGIDSTEATSAKPPAEPEAQQVSQSVARTEPAQPANSTGAKEQPATGKDVPTLPPFRPASRGFGGL